jgi:tetratricopeptide (TPR) repeat protein
LWREGLEAAAKKSFRMLRAEAAASEAELPFTLLGDLLGSDVAGVLGELPGPQRRALEVALLLEDPGSGSPEPRTIGVAVAGAVGLLARERPLLVAIDDVQWIDAASRAALEFALRRIRLEPVVLLLTRRGGSGEPPPLGLSRVMADNAFTRVAIGPLSLPALSELLRVRLGFSCPRPTLRRIAEESDGNPFFALEFASALQRRGARIEPDEPLPVPATLRDLVADRVAALPRGSREGLLVAALASEPTVELVGRALAGDPWERLGPAVRADAIELHGQVIRFTHPLVTSVVRASAEDRDRGDAHRLLAGVVAAGEERAWHLALSTHGEDAGIARVVSEAAQMARAREAPAAAACLLEHAGRLTPGGGEEAGERRLAAARLHFIAGDAGRAEELLHEALNEAPAGVGLARVLYELAGVERETRGAQQGTARYYEALREAEDPELQASIHRELASILRITRDVKTARELADAAVASARQVGDRRVLADALYVQNSGASEDERRAAAS